jgi:hypothetical protein
LRRKKLLCEISSVGMTEAPGDTAVAASVWDPLSETIFEVTAAMQGSQMSRLPAFRNRRRQQLAPGWHRKIEMHLTGDALPVRI